MTKPSNRIPAATLSRLMTRAWKDARSAARKSGAPVRTHLAVAMRSAWEEFRFLIHRDRHYAAAKAAELATLPVVPAIVTAAVSDKQRAYAEKKAPHIAVELAKAFKALREGMQTDGDKASVDAAVARLAGGNASFWLDLDMGNLPDVAHIICCRHLGMEIDPKVFGTRNIKLAEMAVLS